MGILSQVCLTYYDMKKMTGIPGLRELTTYPGETDKRLDVTR